FSAVSNSTRASLYFFCSNKIQPTKIFPIRYLNIPFVPMDSRRVAYLFYNVLWAIYNLNVYIYRHIQALYHIDPFSTTPALDSSLSIDYQNPYQGPCYTFHRPPDISAFYIADCHPVSIPQLWIVG